MKTSYTAPLPNGSIAKRVSRAGRLYSHAIIAQAADGSWKAVSWAGNAQLAANRVREFSRWPSLSQVQAVPATPI